MGECYRTGDISLWNRLHLCSDGDHCDSCCHRWRRYYINWSNIWDPALHFIFSWNSVLCCDECPCETKHFLRGHKRKVSCRIYLCKLNKLILHSGYRYRCYYFSSCTFRWEKGINNRCIYSFRKQFRLEQQ